MGAGQGLQIPAASAAWLANVHMRRIRMIVSEQEDDIAMQIVVRHLLVGKQDGHESESSRTSHRVAAVEAFVAGAGADGDGAADVAGGGVGLERSAIFNSNFEGAGASRDADRCCSR